MRKPLLLATAVAVIGGVTYLAWPREDVPAGEATEATRPAPSSPALRATESASERASEASTPRVRKLSPEARTELGRKIAAAREQARARATTTATTTTPPRADDELKLEDVAKPLQQAFFEAIPLLAECYPDRSSGFRAAARMTLTSDPELGTVIDTEIIKDGDDRPVDPALDTCLRDVIDSLALPPLGDVGGRLQLQYTFRAD